MTGEGTQIRTGSHVRGGEAAAIHRELDALARALDEEAALAESLRDGLVALRASIGRSEAAPIAGAVEAIGRGLLALQEARHRRGRMLADLAGDATFPVAELTGHLEVRTPPALAAARARLHDAAEGVLREAAINRAVLRRAIDHGDRFLQTLFASAAGPRSAYGPAERAAGRAPCARVLVNRRA